jgi:lambda family phage portal protein
MGKRVTLGRQSYDVPWNLFDRAVELWDPVRARARFASRVQMAALSGGYTGASKGKRTLAGMQVSKGGTADQDLLGDLPTLRDRTRHLVRNQPLAGGALNTVCTNVVGTGLMLESQIDRGVLGMTDEQAAEWQRGAEREFTLWCGTPECDVTRTQDFWELQDLAFRSTLESGDIFALLPYVKRPGDTYGLKVQLVEGDRVRDPVTRPKDANLAGGIEHDSYGAPVAAHIARQKPGERFSFGGPSDRVAFFGENGRRNVLHLFERRRPGQSRGAPYLASVIEPLYQLGRYTEAEIDAAVVSGLFAVFVKSAGTGLSPLESAVSGAAPSASGDAPQAAWDGKLTSGLVADLAPGEDIVSANPGRPNQAFDPFVQAVLRQIGAGLELPFEILIKHYTSSYSAARAAILEAWRFYRKKRVWLASRFCQPVYETFLEEAIALGRLSAPGFFDDRLIRAAYCGALWHGDGPGSIDPMADVEAAEKRLALGITTLKKETAEYDGSDWQKNHEQRAKEIAAQRAAGMPVPGDKAPAPTQPAPEDDPDAPERADPNEPEEPRENTERRRRAA